MPQKFHFKFIFRSFCAFNHLSLWFFIFQNFLLSKFISMRPCRRSSNRVFLTLFEDLFLFLFSFSPCVLSLNRLGNNSYPKNSLGFSHFLQTVFWRDNGASAFSVFLPIMCIFFKWHDLPSSRTPCATSASLSPISPIIYYYYWHFQQSIRWWGSISEMWGYFLDLYFLWSVFQKGVPL